MKEKTLNIALCGVVALLVIFYAFFGIATTKKIDRLEKENQDQKEAILLLFDMRADDILNESALDTAFVDTSWVDIAVEDTAEYNEFIKNMK